MENNHISRKLLALDALLLISIIGAVFVIYAALHKPVKRTSEPGQIVNTLMFDSLHLEAKAVYVFDLAKNRTVFEKNSLAQLPLASLTKLMTALTAVELFPENLHIKIKK